MKSFLVFSFIFLFISFSDVNGQGNTTYPIPSFNIVSNGSANFLEQVTKSTVFQFRGKRQLNIKNSGSSSGPVQVWAYSFDKVDLLGPYTVYPGETLTIGIDEREWGVITESESEVILSVWISEMGIPSQINMP